AALPAAQPVLTPMVVFSILSLLILALSFSLNRFAIRFFNAFDFLFFFITGLAGWVMLAMWLGTEHDVCRNNFNLLFALPTHAIAAFFIHRKKWISVYFRVVFILSILLLLSWWLLPQQMNNALIPIVLIITVRSGQLQKSRGYDRKRDAL